MATSTGGIAASEAAVAAWLRTGTVPADFSLDRHHAIHGALPVVCALTGVRGPAYVVSTACSSSAKVFASARRMLIADVVDAVVVGGVDTLARMTLHGFNSLGVLSSEPCRPFSSERAGINIGEGGAFALVEREGTGRARLLGVGETSDAHHMTQPHPEGRGAHDAMARALSQGGVSATDVDHVNAHGTGTRQNDAGESRAIRDLLGPEVPVVATKGYTGHMLGAAGVTEVVFSIAAIERGRVPASVGADPVDPELGVALVETGRDLASRHVLSNSLAFGGSNVSVLIGGEE
jgi:3-oxoacyl-[acyl-carrier-protein] synthase-1